MKQISLIPNIQKGEGLKVTKALVEIMRENNIKVGLPHHVASSIGEPDLGLDAESLYRDSEMIIALGGDGTFLGVARKAYGGDSLLLGINLGTLGFLAEIDKSRFVNAMDDVIKGNFKVQDRMMLSARIVPGKKNEKGFYALNDIVVNRGPVSRLITLKVYVNDECIENFPADGIIVSTPTGSTAYSLSAGGPIVDPDMSLMIITPICPHILHGRSIVVPDGRVISIMHEAASQEAMLTIDGQDSWPVSCRDRLSYKKPQNPCGL